MRASNSYRSGLCRVGGLALCLTLAGCDTDFEKPSAVRGIRVLAVRSDPASGVPGTSVKLELLAADGGAPAAGRARTLQLLWLAGCNNPPTRQFYGCFPLLHAAASLIDTKVISTPASRFPPGIFKATSFELSDASSTGFEFVVPQDILTSAQRSSVDAVHYGVSYAFFALCAGELRTNPKITDGIPFECFAADGSKPLGYRDFVTGFSTIYTYDGATNQSPELKGLNFQGTALSHLAEPCSSDADCAGLVESDAGFDAGCAPSGVCSPRVRPCRGKDCSKFLVEPLVDRSVAEALPEGGSEVVWTSFYSTDGSFDDDTLLVNDRHAGFLGNRGTSFKPPSDAVGAVNVWVTLNDQRGGATWQSFEVLVSEP